MDALSAAELDQKALATPGALLSALVALSAAARRTHPDLGDGAAFRQFLGERHDWVISVEHRGDQVDLDQLFWKWMRCELVHTGALPVNLRVDEHFADPESLTVRAGGAPEHVVLVTPAWFGFLTHSAQ